MRGKQIRSGLSLLVLLVIGATLFVDQRVRAQGGNPLIDDRPVTITRKAKPNRKKTTKPRHIVQKVPLLRLQWRVLKVRDNGTDEETSPLALFHVGDRLRLAIRTNQNGYLYIIHQASPTEPGQIIFPDSRVNGGRNDVTKAQELRLPSNCPAGMSARDCALIVAPPAGREVFTLVFTRDPIVDLPNSAAESTGGIPVATLMKLRSESSQSLRRVKGTTPLSVLVVNTDTKDNEDIYETLLLNKGQ
jgi:hypothetical protein